MNYRPEIDGLRALAVTIVILNHAQISISGVYLFQGGFIGVDIFFVISGYLISRIVISELQISNSFNFFNFLEKRSRRILPMLLVIIFISLILGWLKLTPSNYIELAKSVFATIHLFSNFFFYSATSDYFNQDAQFIPLLHTWSLAVEEQFYIVFPLFVFFVFKSLRKHLFNLIIIISILSMLFANFYESKNAIFNFYLPYSRIWELTTGSILAYIELNFKKKDNKYLSKILPLCGIFIIFFSLYFFDKNTPHPSIYTFFPVIGSSMIIMYSSKNEILGRVLSSKTLVFTGLISYSLYLWHFPIFAYSKIENELTNYDKFALIIITILISIVTYFLIEKPLRNRVFIKTKKFLLIIFSSYILILLSIFLIYFSDGFRFYIPPPDLEEAPTEKIEANIAVIGDSHAHHLEYGLKVLTNGMVKMYQSPGCIPFRDVDRYDHRQKAGDCVKHTNNSLDLITQSKVIDTVILSTMGPVYIDNKVFQEQDLDRIIKQNVYDIKNPNIKDRYKIFENGFERTVNELHNKNKKIIFIIDIPELGRKYKSCIVKNIKIRWRPLGPIVKGKIVDKDNCKYNKNLFIERTKKYRDLIFKLKEKFPFVIVLDAPLKFCDNKYCYGYRNNTLLYKNADHLNNHGSLYLADYILDNLIKD